MTEIFLFILPLDKLMGRVKKRRKKIAFSNPPLLMEKIKKKNKNDLHALKQIPYNIGHLTIARWLFQKAWKLKPPI